MNPRGGRRTGGPLAAALLALAAGLGLALFIAACGGSSVKRTSNLGAPTATTVTDQLTTPLPGAGKPPVMLGDMNTPEQFILGALYEAALTAQGFTVEVTRNLGAVGVRKQAILQGILDLYPEYLNVWDAEVAGYRHGFASLRAAYRAGDSYAVSHNLALLTPTPFSDTSGIAVMRSFAQANDLNTLADLQRIEGTLILGSPLEFSEQPTGLPAVERQYRFLPESTVAVNIGAQYPALRNGQINAAYVSTTDGQLSQPRYKLLSDPKHVLGFGNIVPVVTAKALATDGPALALAIEQVDALLTPAVMQGLNAEVELGHHDPNLVAREFLQGNGILPPPAWSTTTSTTTTGTLSATTTTATTTAKAAKRRLSRTRRRHARKHLAS
jgi:osmoprotectant transport system substrate-binding protein